VIGNFRISFHFSGYNLLLPKDLTHKNMEVCHDHERSSFHQWETKAHPTTAYHCWYTYR
jgi:hypothetical protein